MRMTGLVHVYTGNGKGKTTASLGLCFRALGRGYTVFFFQFMKGDLGYGEILSAGQFPSMQVRQFGRDAWVNKNDPDPEDVKLAQEGIDHVKKTMAGVDSEGKDVLMVLDELNVAVDFGLVQVDDVVDLIASKPRDLELVITGRGARGEVTDLANYVTEMREIKHPYQDGIQARKGIEF